MEIRNTEGEQIMACFSFEYKGLEISCSTIAAPSEIVVFSTKRNQEYRAISIPDAIQWIDTNGRYLP